MGGGGIGEFEGVVDCWSRMVARNLGRYRKALGRTLAEERRLNHNRGVLGMQIDAVDSEVRACGDWKIHGHEARGQEPMVVKSKAEMSTGRQFILTLELVIAQGLEKTS